MTLHLLADSLPAASSGSVNKNIAWRRNVADFVMFGERGNHTWISSRGIPAAAGGVIEHNKAISAAKGFVVDFLNLTTDIVVRD